MKKLILTLAILATANSVQAIDQNGWCYQPVVVNNQIYYQQVQCQQQQPQQQQQQKLQPLTFYGARTTTQGATNLVGDVATGIQSVRYLVHSFKGGF